MKRSFTTPIRVAALALLALAPLACGDDDPATPSRVATDDLLINASSTTISAFTGQTFTLPSGGGELDPAWAGQSVTATFTAGSTPTATLVVGGTTIQSRVSFGSCLFTVTSVTGANAAGITVGETITVNPCQKRVRTRGNPANGATRLTDVELIFGAATSTPVRATVIINPNGTIIIRGPDGGSVTVGTVTTTPAT
jgi:hypothetical protein